MTERLRTALLELADVPPPPDLAGAALTRARRDRRRTAIGLVAALAAVVAVAVPFAGLRREVVPPAAPAWPQLVVTGYSTETYASAGDWEYRVYDRASGTYVTAPWAAAVPSPDGRLVKVVERGGSGRVGIVASDRVLDRTAVRWIQSSSPHDDWHGPGVWSPDGTQLLMTESASFSAAPVPGNQDNYQYSGFVVDARTLLTQPVRLRSATLDFADAVVFGPDGKSLATFTARYPGEPTNLSLWDDGGRLLGRVLLQPGGATDRSFSPDGRAVALVTRGRGVYNARTAVLDRETGAPVGPQVDGTFAGWADDTHYVVWARTFLRMIDAGSGRVLAERDVPMFERLLSGVWVAPLVGAVPPGAIVVA